MENLTFEMLFPTPVLFKQLNRELTKEELNFFNLSFSEDKFTQNVANKCSKNSYILDQEELLGLKKTFTECVNDYFQHVYKPKYPIDIFITQSWLNITNQNEHHHVHNHCNSLVSCVFYLEVDEKEDSIVFHESLKPNQLQIESKSYDNFNARAWIFKVKKGQLVIFPSYLTHSVQQSISDRKRISLAFNTFFKGTIGEAYSFSELKI
jgi:uncharacterized protein (TIGR02466 family)